MKQYSISIGNTNQDSMFLESGFSVAYETQEGFHRNCAKEFKFKSLVPSNGGVILEFTMAFLDQSQVMELFCDDKKLGEITPCSTEFKVYSIEMEAVSCSNEDAFCMIKCVLKNDPFFPPKQAVKLSKITMISSEHFEFSSCEQLTRDKIRQYPFKISNCYRTCHEIRKLAPTYHCRADEYQYSGQKTIFFGDVHVHTQYSPCGYPFNGTIEENIICAKERNHDFICFADHAEAMNVDIFKQYFAECEMFSKKHNILVIPCIEWTSLEYGHRNVYMKNFTPPFFNSHIFETNTPRKLKNYFNKHNVEGFAITHHPAYISHPANLDSIDDTFEPLIEIFSTWGSSERFNAPLQETQQTTPGFFVVDALSKGKKLGFVGGGDVHNTKPGDGGITGIVAEELTVESIIQAMKNRHCYAISNDKISLDFHLNGYPMGSIIKVNQYEVDKLFPIQIAASTICENPILKMELVQNGEVVYEKTFREAKIEMDLFIEYDKLMTPARITNSHQSHLSNNSRYYYIRVTQMDGCMAWSSPIWIDIIPNE